MNARILALLTSLTAASLAPAAPSPLVEGRFSPLVWNVISDNDLNANQAVTDFGSVDLLTPNDRRYRIGNAGNGTLMWEGASSSDGQFEVLNSSGGPQGFPIPILGGDSREFIIRFRPNAIGVEDTTITLETNLTSLNAEYTFAVEGVGVAPSMHLRGKSNQSAPIEFIPDGETSVSVAQGTDFGNFPLAGGYSTHFFGIWNNGNQNLNLSNARIEGPGAAHFSIHGLNTLTGLSSGNFREFEIRFNPQSAGTKNATFSIDSNDPYRNPYNFALRGVATTFPEIEFKGRRSGGTGQSFSDIADGDSSPDAGNGTEFWTTAVGSSGDSRFRVYNAGNAPLSLSTPSLSGAHASQFSILPLSTSDLPAGQNREFVIRFTPSSAGIKTATFSIPNSDNTESPFNFTIRGSSFVTPVPEIRLSGKSSVSGGYIDIENGETAVSVAQGTDFGNFPLSGGFSTNYFQITNDGNERLTVDDIYLTGLGAPQFSIHDQTGNAANPGDTILFEIRFDPGSPGTHQAEVRIDNDDPDEARFTFGIEGTAVIFPEIAVEGRRTGGVGQRLSEVEDDSVAVFSSNGTKFPNTNWGDSNDSLFRIYNTSSDASLTLEMPEIIGTDADQFTILPFLTDPIPPRGYRDLFIRFAPDSPGPKLATFSMGTNDEDEDPFNFAIFGEATGGPDIRVSVRTVAGIYVNTSDGSEEEWRINYHESTHTWSRGFRIRNVGSAPLEINSIRFETLGGTPEPELSGGNPAVIPPGAQYDFVVVYTPTEDKQPTTWPPTPWQARMIIENNDPGPESTYDVRVFGHNHGPNMRIRHEKPATNDDPVVLEPGTTTPTFANGLHFGDVAVASGSNGNSFYMYSYGDRALQISDIVITGPAAGDFTVEGLPGTPFTITDNNLISSDVFMNLNRRDFSIIFRPTATGNRDATISFVNNTSFKNPYSLAVRGRGLTGLGTPSIAVNGAGQTIRNGEPRFSNTTGTYFGTPAIGAAPITRTFLITAGTNELLRIFSLRSDHPSFTITRLTDDEVQPFSRVEFDVTFTPVSGGPVTAEISIGSDDPNNFPFTFTVGADVQGPPTEPDVEDVTIDDDNTEVTIEGEPGTSYRLLTSTTLEPGSWEVVPGYEDIVATGGLQVFYFQGLFDPAVDPKRFFLLEEN